jgi:hypothetical protein
MPFFATPVATNGKPETIAVSRMANSALVKKSGFFTAAQTFA